MTIPRPLPESLYALLPAVYRIADHDRGEPLRALLDVLEEPYRTVERNIAALYDDWFVETCAPWLLPYLGELVGVQDTLDPAGAIPTVRARVADALAYARRKGPAWVLAQAAADVTGWPARAVEYWRELAQTQDLGDVRPALGRTADLRLGVAVEAGTPFDAMAHTVEVRGDDSTGRWAADRVGLFLWRLRSYPLALAQPRPAGSGRFTFCPFGADTPLFLPPRAREAFAGEPAPWEVPDPVSRELLVRVLEGEGRAHDPWQEGEYPVLRVWAGDDAASAVRCRLVPADLAGWGGAGPAAEPAPRRPPPPAAAVDPVLGRLAFLHGARPAWVGAEWSYGFGADLGGGPYARGPAAPAPAPGAFVAVVGGGAGGPGAAATVAEALALWMASPAPDGVVHLADSGIHPSPPEVVTLDGGRRLWIVAAPGERPCLAGDLNLRGLTASGVILDGVLVDGTVRLSGTLDLVVHHCTVRPGVPGVPGGEHPAVAAHQGFAGSIAVQSSVLGPLEVPGSAAGVSLADSIICGGEYAVAADGDADAQAAAPLRVERCTVFGLVCVSTLTARDSIFVDLVLVEHVSTGGLVCCYAPLARCVPRRERCLPVEGGPAVRPFFTSTRYGDPAFAQLHLRCDPSIRTGASDGAEMGAFHLLDTPRREANLRVALAEFLPTGLEAVVSYVT